MLMATGTRYHRSCGATWETVRLDEQDRRAVRRLALDGPGDAPILSDQDAAALSLEEALLTSALPNYGDSALHA
jgi:hypothetical protein